MVVCFMKNEKKNQGVVPKNHFPFCLLEVHEYKGRLKNVGNNEQMKHKRMENTNKVFEYCLPTRILNV